MVCCLVYEDHFSFDCCGSLSACIIRDYNPLMRSPDLNQIQFESIDFNGVWSFYDINFCGIKCMYLGHSVDQWTGAHCVSLLRCRFKSASYPMSHVMWALSLPSFLYFSKAVMSRNTPLKILPLPINYHCNDWANGKGGQGLGGWRELESVVMESQSSSPTLALSWQQPSG